MASSPRNATINRPITFLATDPESRWLRDKVQEELGLDLGSESDRATLGQAMSALSIAAIEARHGLGAAPVAYAYRDEPCSLEEAYQSLGDWLRESAEGGVAELPLYMLLSWIKLNLADSIAGERTTSPRP